MSERIYISADDGALEALEETPFSDEDELQALIAEHPELLDGEQVRPGNARRWILVTREKGIAPSSGAANRWFLDHLIIDQDAVPTLAELKRGSNPEIRRTIVGQLLEYAAHASQTWTAEELRAAFEHQVEAQGGDPQDELATLLQSDGEPDMDGFWDKVSTNLAARRLRLLFVADRIPDELAQVVAFLNTQMPRIEVLAVEVKRFQGRTVQTLVPRVIGRTPAGTSRGRSRQRLTRESFLEGFEDDDVRRVAARLLDVTLEAGGQIVYAESFGLSIRVRSPAWQQLISVAWLYNLPGKGWMRTRDFSFGVGRHTHKLPEELRAKLERWANLFRPDDFTEDVSSKGVQAWAVRHDLAVPHQDLLVSRLRAIISEMVALQSNSFIDDEFAHGEGPQDNAG